MTTVLEPQTEPRLRFNIGQIEGVWTAFSVTDISSGQVFSGAQADALWQAKRDRDAVAGVAADALRLALPQADEVRLDVGDVVVFGLPADLADDHGEAVAAAVIAALPDAVSEGRIAVVWA